MSTLLPPLDESELQQAIYALRGIFDAMHLADEGPASDENARRNIQSGLIAAGQCICKRITDQF